MSINDIKNLFNNSYKFILEPVIKINNQNFQSYGLFNSLNKENRFLKIVEIDNTKSLHLLICLQNPSKDDNNCILNKLIKKFYNDHPDYDNISTITIINVSSYITPHLEDIPLNIRSEKYTSYNQENIEVITKLLDSNNYDEIYLGVGQHPLSSKCKLKKEFNQIFPRLINLIKEKQPDKWKYFGKMVKDQLLPCYPRNPSIIEFKDLDINKINEYIRRFV